MFREFLGTCSDTLPARPCLNDIALVWAAQQICKVTTQSPLHFPQSSRSCLDILDITSWFDVVWLSLSLSISWQPWYLDCRSSTTLSRPSSSSLAFMAVACSFEPATWTKGWPAQCRWDTSFMKSYVKFTFDLFWYVVIIYGDIWWDTMALPQWTLVKITASHSILRTRWTRVIRKLILAKIIDHEKKWYEAAGAAWWLMTAMLSIRLGNKDPWRFCTCETHADHGQIRSNKAGFTKTCKYRKLHLIIPSNSCTWQIFVG